MFYKKGIETNCCLSFGSLSILQLIFLNFESNQSELFCIKAVLTCAFESEFERFWIGQHQLRKRAISTLTKLGALLKVCHFSRYVEVFWILIERLNSEYSQKVRYSGKYLLISLGYGGISLWYLLASWEDLGVIFYL